MTQQELPAPLAELTGLMTECANNGDYAGAARQANELVTLCRATLGERHPTALELKVSLATLQLRAGDDATAYEEFARLIPDLVEVLGRDHLSTLTARHLLAGRQQPSLSSLAEWSQLFADEQRILGAEHESTLVARENVAEKRWEIGDVVGAMAEGEHVLEARRRVLGDNHVDTLGTRLMLAIWRGRAGNVPEAVAELESLIGELRERLGDHHAHLLMARHMFTLWAPERAGVKDEVAAWEALAEEEARVLGEKHPVTLAARQALAGWCARRGEPASESGAHESLAWWLNWINVLIDMMADTYLKGAVPLDYSEASLRALENVVCQRYRYPIQLLNEDHFVAGAAAYLGETLMRVGGGAWEWTTEATETSFDCLIRDSNLLLSAARHRWRVMDEVEVDAAGLPVVVPDPATQLAKLSPVHLLLDAVESGGGGVMVGVYQRWRRAVDESAAAESGWSPAKERTLADGYSPPRPSPVLDAWLIRQRHNFPVWAARYRGDWDYTPETIDRLTELVGRVTPTVEALRDPANREFIEGAMYYLGEMLRRRYPSRWVYREFHDDDDPDLASFRIQLNGDTGFTSPFYLLHLMLLEGSDPGRARAFYDDWVS